MCLQDHSLGALGRLIAAEDAHALGNQAVGLQDLAHLGELLLDIPREVAATYGQSGKQIGQSDSGAHAAGAGRALLELALVVEFHLDAWDIRRFNGLAEEELPRFLLTHFSGFVTRLDDHIRQSAKGAQSFSSEAKGFHAQQVHKLPNLRGVVLGSFK